MSHTVQDEVSSPTKALKDFMQLLFDDNWTCEDILEAVHRLRELQGSWPILEFVDSREQWLRLRFTKWLCSQGEYDEFK